MLCKLACTWLIASAVHEFILMICSDNRDSSPSCLDCRHSIEPGRWNLDLMEYSNFSEPLLSLKLALHIWYHAILPNEGKRFLDNCQGPFCNEKCPNSFSLGMLTSNNWSVQVKITLAAVVVGIGVACLLMKFLFKLWLYRLEKKQDDYLEQLEGHLQNCDSHLEVRKNGFCTYNIGQIIW